MHYTATFRKRLSPKGGFRGMLWDIFLCLHLMFLCRRWWISCRTLSNSFVGLSKCPSSCLSMSLCARPCALRSWWNSWWKCRRSCPIPRYSGLWNSMSTFQFLLVEGDSQVFKVFFPDRVQQRRLSCRSLTFPVEVFKVLASFQSPAGSDDDADEPGEGVFALFPVPKKVRSLLRTQGEN